MRPGRAEPGRDLPGGDVNRSLPLFVRRYDADSAAPLGRAVRVANRSVVTTPMMSPDGRLLASIAANMRTPFSRPNLAATYAIDAETLRVVRRYPVGAADSSGISPDGSTLAIAGEDGGLRVLDLASGRVRTLAAPGGPDSHEGSGAQSRREDPGDLRR